jgi:UDP-2,3-diacylglucosamine hydrolase
VILLISDLHLCSARPEISRIFFDFVAGRAREAEAVYILGDLFDYWAGDDDLADPFNEAIALALARCSASTAVRLMHGNRDFLIGERFAAAAGAQLVADPTLIEVDGLRTLLSHGDTLCTDDTDYQRFRAEIRSPGWVSAFLATPLDARRKTIESLREQSEREKQLKPAAIMDVTAGAVESLFRAHGYPRLVHGHTHRPARHAHRVDGRNCERWVLADWRDRGSVLVCERDNWRVEELRSRY